MMFNESEISLLDPPRSQAETDENAALVQADEGAVDSALLPAVAEKGVAKRGVVPRKKKRTPSTLSTGSVCALDLGTTKICALIGRLDDHGKVKLQGMGRVPSRGLKRGMVANIDQTVESIREAIAIAEAEAGREVSEVYVGIAGGHIACQNSQAMIEVANPTRGVSAAERRRVLERCKAVEIPDDREIIHVIPQEFICDKQRGVKQPIGMCCSTLQARVHLVTAAVTSAQNIVRCVHQAGLKTADLLLESLASSMSILNDEEKELGALLIDLGGGTSDVAVFQDGAVRFSGVVPFAGQSITNDVAEAFRLGSLDAQLVKHGVGTALPEEVAPTEPLDLHSVMLGAPTKKSRRFLAEVVEARCIEILENAREMVHAAGYGDAYRAGVVLTGGSSLVEGIRELAEKIFDCEVRLGAPPELTGRTPCPGSPIFATVQGLLMYGLAREQNSDHLSGPPNFMGLVYKKFMKMIDWYV